MIEHGCPEDSVENPQTRLITDKVREGEGRGEGRVMDDNQDEELSDHGEQIDEKEAVQLKPQEMHVWVRPGQFTLLCN